MESPQYRYRAFISYRHTESDRKWAKWLMSKLETYKTPKTLVNQGTPQRIGRVFRDDDEIPASSDLGHQLEDALRDSEFLIVICSPNTPTSHWVRQEISFFQQLGRGDRIIPLLVEGEPESSFPPELLHLQQKRTLTDGTVEEYSVPIEPLAADVRPRTDEKNTVTEHRALIRILATLLKCRYDDLEQREKQRQRKLQHSIYALVSTLTLAVIAGGLWWWDYHRIKTDYYLDYVEQYGVPQGIGPLSEAEASHMNAAYALQYQQRQLIRMVRQTGAQKALALSDDPQVAPWLVGIAEWRLQYNREGQVNEITLYNEKGKKRLEQNYKFTSDGQKATVSFRSEDNEGRERTAQVATLSTLLGETTTKNSDIAQHFVRFDNNGRVVKREFETSYGVKTKDSAGAAGNTYAYNNAGQLSSIGYLDLTGKALSLNNGIATIHLDYSPDAKLQNIFFSDQYKNLINGPKNYHRMEYQYDPFNNPIEQRFYAADGQAAMHPEGYFKRLNTFDVYGNLTSAKFLDAKEQLTLHKEGYAKQIAVYDASGNLTELAYLGVDGQATLYKNGYAKMTVVYDARGNFSEFAYFGVDGQPAHNKDGCAKLKQVWDDRGNLIEQAYLGVDGQPTLNTDGYAKLTQIWDVRSNLIGQAYFGVDGQATLHKNGYAKMTAVYDARGNLTEEEYFGIDGQATLHKNGYAKMTAVYDASGNRTEVTYFGVDGQATLHKDGYAKLTQVWDTKGNIIELACFGDDGQATLHKNGYAKITAVYDVSGNRTEMAYFGVDGQATLHKDGYAKLTQEWDVKGNLIEQAYFGIDGQATLHKNGYAKMTAVYDVSGNRTEVAYFRGDGQAMLNKYGYAKVTQAWDARGNLIEVAYFGVNGQAMLNKNGYAKMKAVYDVSGNRIEVAYFGEDGQAMLNKYGYAKVSQAWDARGNLIERTYFGVDGQLIDLHE